MAKEGRVAAMISARTEAAGGFVFSGEISISTAAAMAATTAVLGASVVCFEVFAGVRK
jgi:hypothetical protein